MTENPNPWKRYTMNEIYKLLVNIHEIVKANNMFLTEMEQRLVAIEQKVTIEETSGPGVPGTENVENQ